MTVRLKLALTIFTTGLVTALLVIASVVVAFERFERETAYHCARSFLARVAAQYDNLIDLRERHPAEVRVDPPTDDGTRGEQDRDREDHAAELGEVVPE